MNGLTGIDALIAEHRDRQAIKNAEIERLRAINADLLAALEEVEEYFDDRADAEYHTDSAAPTGNEEMRFLVFVRAAIRKAKP